MLVVGACASGSSSSGTARRGDRNTVTAEELATTASTNLYDFVQRSRPLWLRTRGRTSVNNEGIIIVYLDDSRFGGPETLRQISPLTVQQVRFLDASAAQQRFGVGHTHGAILVYSKR
jgi:hypothetical protein